MFAFSQFVSGREAGVCHLLALEAIFSFAVFQIAVRGSLCCMDAWDDTARWAVWLGA